VQSAKDSFYEAMRGRLAAVNPARTVEVRGVQRPAVLVMENELATQSEPMECFCLRWTKASVASGAAMPVVMQVCEIRYATKGIGDVGGMDRGRTLAAMDAEATAIVNAGPQVCAKTDSSGLPYGRDAKALQSQVWWSDAEFGPVEAAGGVLRRVARVAVMSYEEAGEA